MYTSSRILGSRFWTTIPVFPYGSLHCSVNERVLVRVLRSKFHQCTFTRRHWFLHPTLSVSQAPGFPSANQHITFYCLIVMLLGLKLNTKTKRQTRELGILSIKQNLYLLWVFKMEKKFTCRNPNNNLQRPYCWEELLSSLSYSFITHSSAA